MPIQRGGTILRGWCDETETENRNRSLKKNSYPHVKGVVVPEKMKLSLLFFLELCAQNLLGDGVMKPKTEIEIKGFLCVMWVVVPEKR